MGKKVSHTRVLAALIACPTIKAAAVECGISERVMHAYAREAEIADELRKARQEMGDTAKRAVLHSVTEAIGVLSQIMLDKTMAPMPRVLAAKALLDQAMRAAGLADAERRLQWLCDRGPVVIIDDIHE